MPVSISRNHPVRTCIVHKCINIDALMHTSRIHEYIRKYICAHTCIDRCKHTHVHKCIRTHIHACYVSFGSVIITVGGMSTTSRCAGDGAEQRSSPFGDCHAAGARFLQAMYVLALTPHRVHRVRKLVIREVFDFVSRRSAHLASHFHTCVSFFPQTFISHHILYVK